MKNYLPKFVLIPSFDLDDKDSNKTLRTWKAKFFHNFPGGDSDGKELAVDVALSTSAAPIYFPSYNGFVDGGVIANSPSMAAVAQALDEDTADRSLASIRLLSLGTGSTHSYIPTPANPDWGLTEWGLHIFDMLFDGAMGVADYQCQRLLKDHYHRLAPGLPGSKSVALDDYGSTQKLLDWADTIAEATIFKETADWVKGNLR